MFWRRATSFPPVSRLWGTLAFRLTAAYALAGLFLVFVATASLYMFLVSELDKSTDLFLADKENVLRTMLRERPYDEDVCERKLSSRPPRAGTSNSTFAGWTIGTDRYW
jgi:two-component system, OmpR family, heavy metal sensor histidine kinase CusS